MYSPGTEQFALLHPFHLVMDELTTPFGSCSGRRFCWSAWPMG